MLATSTCSPSGRGDREGRAQPAAVPIGAGTPSRAAQAGRGEHAVTARAASREARRLVVPEGEGSRQRFSARGPPPHPVWSRSYARSGLAWEAMTRPRLPRARRRRRRRAVAPGSDASPAPRRRHASVQAVARVVIGTGSGRRARGHGVDVLHVARTTPSRRTRRGRSPRRSPSCARAARRHGRLRPGTERGNEVLGARRCAARSAAGGQLRLRGAGGRQRDADPLGRQPPRGGPCDASPLL